MLTPSQLKAPNGASVLTTGSLNGGASEYLANSTKFNYILHNARIIQL